MGEDYAMIFTFTSLHIRLYIFLEGKKKKKGKKVNEKCLSLTRLPGITSGWIEVLCRAEIASNSFWPDVQQSGFPLDFFVFLFSFFKKNKAKEMCSW